MNKEMKENIGNEHISGLNAWAIGVMRYSIGIIDQTKEELQETDWKTRTEEEEEEEEEEDE